MRTPRALVGLLALVAAVGGGTALVATPAQAVAVAFTVNSLADASDANAGNGTCATAASVCTLRAAIQEANAGAAGNTYTISFSVAGTMQEASELPIINRSVTIDGSTAPGYAAATGPTFVVACNGSDVNGANGIGATAANITIRALEIVNCGTAIITSAQATGLTVVGNYLGSDGTAFSATKATRAGVTINGANSTVGGSTVADRNVISGYLAVGVSIVGGVTGAVVQGNYIGPDRTGTVSLRNPASQPGDGASPSTIGIWSQGSGSAIRNNLISGNAGTGIYVSAGSATITGNTIGPDVTGTQALGNSGSGIVATAGTTTTIGGTGAGDGNLIAAWRPVPGGISTVTDLVRLIGATSTIQGNKIGTNATGTASLCRATGGNDNVAMSIEPSSGGVGSNVTVGGTAAGAGNLIAGCSRGVVIERSSGQTGSSTVTIQGNRLGTNAAGTAAMITAGTSGVMDAGVVIGAGQKVTVGGTAAGAGNVISGFTTGIFADDDDSGILIQGNRIGTNAAGTAAVPNTFQGVRISATPAGSVGSGGHPVIGGTTAAAANVISGNGDVGLLVARPATVQGNLIGTDATGTTAIPNKGVSAVTLNDPGITFGGTAAGAGNTVSGNTYAGIQIAGAQVPTIQGNRIGTTSAGNAALPNGRAGIFVGSGTTSGSIGGTGAGQGNLISGNAGDGVQIIGGSGVGVRGNLTYGNTGLNIDLFQHGDAINVGNHDQIHPTLTTAVVGAASTTVGGTVTSDRTGTITVDVYAGSSCQAAYGAGQAQQYLGSLSVPYPVAGVATSFSGQVAKPTVGSVITATSTIAGNGTSQLSTCATYTDIDVTAKDTYASAPIGSDVATEFTVTNHGPATATGVGIDLGVLTGPQAASDTASIDLPSAGSVNGSTSVWTIPTLASGASATVCVRGDIARASFQLEPIPGVFVDVPVSWAPDATLDTASGVVDPYTGNNQGSGATQVAPKVAGADVCPLPTLSIDDASLQRPASGTSPMTFTVHLSKAQTRSVTVHWATSNGKAVAVEDYVASSGDLTFAAGQTTKTFTVPIVGNQSDEPDKAFTVTLSAPVHATLADATASGTVLANHLLQGCPPGSTGNQRFVCHLYFDALGRAPEAGGFTYWVNKLNKGTARATMAKSYLTQPESLRKVADRAYVLYLGRHGTTSELGGWATKLANKTATTQDVRIAVLSSAEYFTKVGATNDKFVKQLFFDVFRRNVDASGLAYWTGQLTSGKSRTNVATRFMAEPEGRRKIIGDIYLRFLRRDPTTNEANGWVDQLAAGKTEVDVGIGLVASTEYYQRPEG